MTEQEANALNVNIDTRAQAIKEGITQDMIDDKLAYSNKVQSLNTQNQLYSTLGNIGGTLVGGLMFKPLLRKAGDGIRTAFYSIKDNLAGDEGFEDDIQREEQREASSEDSIL